MYFFSGHFKTIRDPLGGREVGNRWKIVCFPIATPWSNGQWVDVDGDQRLDVCCGPDGPINGPLGLETSSIVQELLWWCWSCFSGIVVDCFE